MKKKAVSLVILTSMFLGGQAVGIIPDSTEVVASAATSTGVVTADVLNVRSTSSTSGKILGKLKNGAKVTIVEKCSNGWYKIKYNSGYGYVSGQYVTIENNNNKGTTGAKVVAEAKKHIGVPYKWGGTTTAGFDCSGYTQYVMKKCGVTIGRTTKDQIKNGTSVNKANLKAGDLVFFKDTYEGCTNPSHVGIYIGGNQFIHASSSKGVTISQLNSNYYNQHYYGARRVIK